MPFRILGYDGAAYRSQLLKTEERLVNGELKQMPVKERYPVITIVLYFGKELWNYSTNLKDSFYPPLPEDEVTEILKKYIPDYKVHVFDIPRLSMETVRMFRSDFRVVAEHFINTYTNPGYAPEDVVITHVDAFLKLMKILTGDDRYEEISRSLSKVEKEGGLMACNVLNAREARGEARGMTIGEERMGKLVSILLGENKIEEAKKAAQDEKIREEYFKLYHI